jgi:hypothetical protein
VVVEKSYERDLGRENGGGDVEDEKVVEKYEEKIVNKL